MLQKIIKKDILPKGNVAVPFIQKQTCTKKKKKKKYWSFVPFCCDFPLMDTVFVCLALDTL